MNDRFAKIIAAIDAANASDPMQMTVNGRREPSEIVYSRRMSAMLDRIYPDATEVLKIAARAQHIERWTSPRTSYPAGRIGYLRWRTDLKNYHASRAGELMGECGYGSEAIIRTQSLIRKEKVKYDAEAQALEDVICLVFLEDYFANFAPKYDEAKVIDILRKTWIKMSPTAQSAALHLDLPEQARRLVERALKGEPS
jgi:Domain of unknown function (DUF4202)